MDGEFDGVEWDEKKSERNLAIRGFGFAYAARVFQVPCVERESRSDDSGEHRFVTTGQVEELLLTVVWTPRGLVRRIISARYASRKERRMYHAYYTKETF